MRFRIPSATYRMQFNRDFRFTDARDLVPYLHELGITDLYASPRFKAKKGSSHGYDVADPQRVNSELGTEEEFDELVRKLKDYSMGIVLDIVPNHMAASHHNPWWMDVLEHGPSSPYAGYFDIDWHPATTKAAFLQENKVLLPVLGDLYGNALENQELLLKLDENGFHIRYYEHRFPLDPRSYETILQRVLQLLQKTSADAGRLAPEVGAVLESVGQLPPYTAEAAAEREARLKAAGVIKERLWRLVQAEPEFRRAVDEVVHQLNGTREDPASFNDLDALLDVQPYRLAHWKIGLEEINYRRFFDINELVGLRVEEPGVFGDRHRVILQLVREGKVTGLRVDHIDGMRDPLGYLRLLQRAAAGGTGTGDTQEIYVVVEKILGERESLPPEWPVAGTTGYDFLNAANAVFIEPAGFSELESIYSRFTGSALPFAEVCYAGNKRAMEQLFAGEVHALSHQLAKLAAQNRRARDLPLYEIVQLLIEVTACLPVYRTYVRALEVTPRDRAFIEKTLAIARRRTPPSRVSDAALGFLQRVLLLDPPFYGPEQKEGFLQFMMSWQQFSGPVMAKGLEDTACYVHNSLISLNEVGSDPLRESLPFDVEAFHLFSASRQAHWPATMNATSTHDTKRSGDARARINVLSELAEEWEECLNRWSRWNHGKKGHHRGVRVPSPSEEVLLYQSMLGSWPLDEAEVPGLRARLSTYLRKAAREAKIHTNWIDPEAGHEAALEAFIDSILDTSVRNRFLTDFLRFQQKIAFHGALNSLAQLLLKIASPGVPDVYQGNELWDFSMVDPDNRRPVDFGKRTRLLDELKREEVRDRAALVSSLVDEWSDGRIKLYVMRTALDFRRANFELFAEGDYVPLSAKGRAKENVCAFARRKSGRWAVAVVPRFTTQLVDPGQPPLGRGVWGASELILPREASPHWRNVFTGELVTCQAAGRRSALRLEQAFKSFPVALLTNASP